MNKRKMPYYNRDRQEELGEEAAGRLAQDRDEAQDPLIGLC